MILSKFMGKKLSENYPFISCPPSFVLFFLACKLFGHKEKAARKANISRNLNCAQRHNKYIHGYTIYKYTFLSQRKDEIEFLHAKV